MVDERLLARIAELYYIDGISQNKIAEKFHFSKAKVCRLIKEAKKRKIINFSIKKFEEHSFDLEKQIEGKFGISEVIVYSEYGVNIKNGKALFEKVGNIAARYVERILKNGIKIAVGSGETLYNVIKSIRNTTRYNIDIYSTLGGITLSKAEYHNNDIAQLLSNKTGGKCHPIFLPMILDKNADKEMFLAHDGMGSIFKINENIDYFISTISNVNESSQLYDFGYWDKEFLEDLRKKDVCGEIGLNFFNKKGEFIDIDFKNRVINLDIDRIRKIKNKIIVVFGEDKVPSLGCFLRTGITDVLITDESTAKALL